MSLTDEERRAIVLYRIEKAHAAMDDIRKVMPLELWSIIANRMYYALYYASSALLINDGHKVGTHKGVIALLTLTMSRKARLPEKTALCSRMCLPSDMVAITTTLSMPRKKM